MSNKQIHVIVNISPSLKLGIMFAYQPGEIKKGIFYFFCNKQEGLELIVEACGHPLNDPSMWQEFIEMVELSESLPEFRLVCGCTKMVFTEKIRTHIQEEIFTQCIN